MSPDSSGRVMNVAIMGDLFGFPHFSSSGATTRVRAYARGLVANGARVKVLCVEPTEDLAAPVNTQVKGSFEGVDFEYTYGSTVRPAPGMERRFRKVVKWWRFLDVTRRWATEVGGLDAMIVYSRKIPWLTAARLACWMTGAIYLHEDVERPFVWQADNPRVRARLWAYERIAFKAFDGCLAISTRLRDYCLAHLRPGAKVLVVPILVDVDEFSSRGDQGAEVADRVAYCGSLSHPQSISVVEAFGAVAGDFPELRLELIGSSRRADAEMELRGLARHLGVEERVDFAGTVTRERLIADLVSARALLLPRPKGAAAEAAAEAALPTKVGEYLAAGRPVVAAASGDIPLYLTDGVDAYLAPTADTEAFSARLRHVLSHPEEADAVGARGRETARKSFDPKVHGGRILEFVRELRRERAEAPRRARLGARCAGR